MLCDVILKTEALGSNSFWMKNLLIEDFFDQQTISLGKENVFGKLELEIVVEKVGWKNRIDEVLCVVSDVYGL